MANSKDSKENGFLKAAWEWFVEKISYYIFAPIGAVTFLLIVLVLITPLNRDLSWGSNAMEHITATSTLEFEVDGIDNTKKLEDRIDVMIKKTKARQQKNEAESTLQKLKKEETSLK